VEAGEPSFPAGIPEWTLHCISSPAGCQVFIFWSNIEEGRQAGSSETVLSSYPRRQAGEAVSYPRRGRAVGEGPQHRDEFRMGGVVRTPKGPSVVVPGGVAGKGVSSFVHRGSDNNAPSGRT